MKRGTDHNWEIRQYHGNLAWYAHCKCGYEYMCSRNAEPGSLKQKIRWLAPYCANCGARKKWYNEVPNYIPKTYLTS